MAKEFTKKSLEEGIVPKEAVQEAEPEVKEYEVDEEGAKALMRANEEDFIQGLIDAAEFASEETKRIEIIRDGKLYFAFRIRPLCAAEYEKCRKKHTKYVRNKQYGMKLPEDTNKLKYQSEIIYQATVEEDREALWDNRRVWDAINAKRDRIMNGLDVIEYSLKAGEKDRILEEIDKLSGFEESNLEEVAKN